MAREYINREDLLNTGREKLNRSIDKSYDAEDNSKQAIKDANTLGNKAIKDANDLGNKAVSDANRLGNEAKNTAKKADDQSLDAIEIAKDTNENMNNIISGTTDSAEIIAARKPVDNVAYTTVGERLNNQLGKLSSFRQEESIIGKLGNESHERGINVTWFGAKGDGITDDTAAIQKAIDSCKDNETIYFPHGKTYMVNGLIGQNLKLKSNINFHIPAGAKLKIIANNNTHYYMFDLNGVSNIVFYGEGTLEGEREDHDGTDGEWGHGFELANCKDITIKGLTINDFWGDGIEFGGGTYAERPINTVIDKVTINNCRRQGISFCNCEEAVLNDVVIDGINGASPACGIDFEPYAKGQVLKGIVINNPMISNCEQTAILFAFADIAGKEDNGCIVDITINNPVTLKCKYDYSFYNYGTTKYTNKIEGKVIINNPMTKDTSRGAFIFTNWFSNLPNIVVNNADITNHGIDETAEHWDPYLSGIYMLTTEPIETSGDTQSAQIDFNGIDIKRNKTDLLKQARGIWIQPKASFTYFVNVDNYSTNHFWQVRAYLNGQQGIFNYRDPIVYINGDPGDIGNTINGMHLVFSSAATAPIIYMPALSSGSFEIKLSFRNPEKDTDIVGYIRFKANELAIFYRPDLGRGVPNSSSTLSAKGLGTEIKVKSIDGKWLVNGSGMVSN